MKEILENLFMAVGAFFGLYGLEQILRFGEYYSGIGCLIIALVFYVIQRELREEK